MSVVGVCLSLKGTTQGYYMFIETSAPRVPGDKARLYSKPYPASPGTIKCFSFWYHMYGADVGSLNVYILTNLASDTFSTEVMRWSLSGDWGNTWQQGQFNISTQYTNQPFKVNEPFVWKYGGFCQHLCHTVHVHLTDLQGIDTL